MDYLIIVLLSYFLGSIPSGLIIGHYFYDIDIREYGSKNIGTTNMFRTLGAKPALFVLLADMLKGMLAVFIASYIVQNDLAPLLAAITAILGHNYSCFLKFKGGKGVATGLGVILMLMPKVTLIVFTVWCLIVFATRYVSLGSIVAAILVPVLAYLFSYPTSFFLFGLCAAIFVVVNHKDNISRLLSGKETKIKSGNIKKNKQ